MKRIVFIFLVFILATGTTFSQSSFGLAGVAGTKAGIDDAGMGELGFGIHARSLTELSEDFGLIGGFTYYLPSTITAAGVDSKWNYMTFNADLAFNFLNEEALRFYGFGGANYTSLSLTVGSASATSQWKFGWEAGAGVIISGHFFLEGKYESFMKQIVGTVGFYF